MNTSTVNRLRRQLNTNNRIKLCHVLELLNNPINDDREHEIKHCVISRNDISYQKSGYHENFLLIKCGEIISSNKTHYLNEIYDGKFPHSYSLSERKLREHRDYLIDGIKNMISLDKMACDGSYMDTNDPRLIAKFGDCIKDVNNEYLRPCTRKNMYIEAYVINIKPPLAFIERKDAHIKIATEYVVTISQKENKSITNIFFDAGHFEFIQSGLSELIDEFNKRRDLENIVPKMPIIVDNLLSGSKSKHEQIGQRWYTAELCKIDEPRIIYDDETNEVTDDDNIKHIFKINTCDMIESSKLTMESNTVKQYEMYQEHDNINNTDKRRLLGLI